jgi:EAL domain-containing protein (putative c-di-GMP-specific phosphodiesterase class I)
VDAGNEGQPFSGEARLASLAGEARLAYLPVVDLGSGQLLGFEALMRWHHPTEGVISPHLLIPWAEANGDIVELGEWVLVEGCKHAAGWPSSMQLAANCSIVQLRNGAGSRAVARALEASGLSPDRLTVEVTEQAMSDEAAVADLLLIIDQGVQLAVDDVGTSWNSFELLRRLAVNTVKIDQSFVSGLEEHEGINRMVVETLVHLAHNGGMSTVAEGVETALQANLVREFESDAAQGYFFAPPLDEEKATRMANVAELRFPLEGPGWQDDDDWPFPGAALREEPAEHTGAAPDEPGDARTAPSERPKRQKGRKGSAPPESPEVA